MRRGAGVGDLSRRLGAVIEASVAQPLEAQIVGVDKMIYMKSTSGNDGSYNLTVSFAVGTNPDTATVNVNNRVQTALPQLPAAVQQQDLTVIKRSAAILQFLNLYIETGKPLLSPAATINVLDELCLASARHCSASSTIRCASARPAVQPQSRRPTSCSHPAERSAVGRIGARLVANDQQFQLNVQTQGTLTTPIA